MLDNIIFPFHTIKETVLIFMKKNMKLFMRISNFNMNPKNTTHWQNKTMNAICANKNFPKEYMLCVIMLISVTTIKPIYVINAWVEKREFYHGKYLRILIAKVTKYLNRRKMTLTFCLTNVFCDSNMIRT